MNPLNELIALIIAALAAGAPTSGPGPQQAACIMTPVQGGGFDTALVAGADGLTADYRLTVRSIGPNVSTSSLSGAARLDAGDTLPLGHIRIEDGGRLEAILTVGGQEIGCAPS